MIETCFRIHRTYDIRWHHWIINFPTGWGPPVISGFINHEITPMNTIVISTIKPLIRQLNAILGAPSCNRLRVMLTMCQFTLYLTCYPLFQRVISSRIRRPGSIRVGNSAVSGFEHLQWALQNETKHRNKSIHRHFPIIFPSFSPHFSKFFWGPKRGPSSLFFNTPRSPETTSEIPEWVCGRSRGASGASGASGLTAPQVSFAKWAQLGHGIFMKKMG